MSNMNQIKETDQTPSPYKNMIPVMKVKWFLISISLAMVGASLFFILKKGFNFGVDFKGGVKLVYKFKSLPGDEKIRSILEPLGMGDIPVVRFGEKKEKNFLVKVKYQEGRDSAGEITKTLQSDPSTEGAALLSEEMVGPKVGADLRKRGTFAIVLTWVLMLIYIGWRFDFLFAPGAIVALLHDVAIGLGFFAFFDKEVNLSILAAVLTLTGYSINDTIIVYDRVRENLRKLSASIPLDDLVTQSINETFSRTIVTSLTVLFAMVILFVFGGGVIHDFAFFMIVGVIVGTYSSIFIASPIYLGLHQLFPHKGLVRRIGKR